MPERKVTPITDAKKPEGQEVVPFGELTARVASSFAIDPGELFRTLKGEFFPNGAASDAQMFVVLQIIDRYKLNPFMHEIYATVSQKSGKLIVGVQYDGFNTIAHRHPHYRGFKLERETDDKGKVKAVICKVYRDDWEHPGEFYAAMDEWFIKGKDTWEQRPVHQLSIKAFNNCVKLTLGLSGLYDQDDIDRINAGQDDGKVERVERRSIETTGTRIVEPPEPQSEPQPQQNFVADTTKQDASAGQAASASDDRAESGATDNNSEPVRVAPRPDSGEPQRETEAEDRPSANTQQESPPSADEDASTGTTVRAKLEHFIAQRVPAARVNLLLGKIGAERVEQLTEEQCAQMLRQLEKRGK